MYDYDMLVIGSGPSGRRAAVQFAKLGKSVLVVEKGRRVGGVSVHTGTIPSKTLRETVLNLSGWRERGFYGRAYRVKQDISAQDLGRRLSITLDHEALPAVSHRPDDVRESALGLRDADAFRPGAVRRPSCSLAADPLTLPGHDFARPQLRLQPLLDPGVGRRLGGRGSFRLADGPQRRRVDLAWRNAGVL